jgi:hypothetical protein
LVVGRWALAKPKQGRFTTLEKRKNGINPKAAFAFFCVQAVGVFAIQFRPDWSLLTGLLLLSPGLPAVYLVLGIHRHFLIRDCWLIPPSVLINGAAWFGVGWSIRRLRNHRRISN